MALTQISTAGVKDDAVTAGKIPANAVGSSELADNAVDTTAIADDAVTADKLANSINSEITANTAKTSNATHTGEVTGGTALTIADNVVDEANLKVSNSPSNGYFLSAQSGNTGGLTWAQVTTDLVGDTSPQLGGLLDGNGQTANFTGNNTGLGIPIGTDGNEPTASNYKGYIRYNDTDDQVYFSDGVAWTKISAKVVVLSSVSGSIVAGIGSNLTLTGSGFLSSNLVVNFLQGSDSINTNLTVSPSSDTTATVAVPAAVYNNVTSGNAVTIKVTNSDGSESSNVNITAVASPTGGTITTSGGFRIHTFTSSGTFGLTYSIAVQYLVIAGGGGAGARRHGGGGGAGGYRCSVSGETSGRGASAETASTLSAGNYTVTVGAGGASATGSSNTNTGNTNGSNSVFGSITSLGGGWGSTYNTSGNSGGCGGGSGSENSTNTTAGSGTTGQGYDGGDGANNQGGGGGGGGGGASAGGGAGGVGSSENGGNGGTGRASSITGSSVTRAGGGGGGGSTSATAGTGGAGGGGNGANSNTNPTSGSANTGGGSGGGGPDVRTAPNGGSGIVIVRYAI